jgi:ABC-type nickel/cobalt efflux system permease component RcnA
LDRSEAILTGQRFIVFRRAIAILCMALAVMLSWQSYISLMDRMEHAHHHAHFANPLAGDVQFCGAQCEVNHHHEADVAGHHHSHDPANHQHGDSVIVFLAAQSFILTACMVPASRCQFTPQTFASFTPRGPDRPPKSFL